VATSLVGFAMIFAVLAALVFLLACADRLFSGGYICSPSPREARRARRARARRDRRLGVVRRRPSRIAAARQRLARATGALGRMPRRVRELPTSMALVRERRAAVRTSGRREFAPALVAARRPLETVAADLRRLTRQLALVPAGTPLVRWRALWTAYDGVLMEAADQLDVPHELRTLPGQIGIERDIERLRVLACLEGAGLVVH
jgi:hypothetical protein